MRSFAVLVSTLLAGTAAASVFPPAFAGSEGDGNFFYNNTFSTGLTYQLLLDDAILGGLAGRQITGMRFRLEGAQGPWSDADFLFADYEVRIGRGVEVVDFSLVFADNFHGTPTQVRDGAYVLPANALPSGASPNAFGPVLELDTAFAYRGGNLLIELRSVVVEVPLSALVYDAAAFVGGPANGYDVDYVAAYEQSESATFGTVANFLVTDLVTEPAPEPSPPLLACLAGAVLAGFRRWRRMPVDRRAGP